MSSSCKKAVAFVLGSVATVALGFLLEPIFPLGSWRWGIVIGICALLSLVVWREEIRTWAYEWMMAERHAQGDQISAPESASTVASDFGPNTDDQPEPEPKQVALDPQRAFELAPSSGRRAAALIEEQVKAEDAEAVYDVWNAQKDKTHFLDVYSAMSALYFRLGDKKKGKKFAVLTGWEQAYTGEDF